jgi:hypothetical protein
MRKSQQIKKPTQEEFKEWFRRSSLIEGLVGFASIIVSLLGLLLSLYVSASESPKRPILVTNSLLYLVGGIILLGVIIVAIGTFLRRKDRDVTILRRRLADIYGLALRKSALNPQPHVTSND